MKLTPAQTTQFLQKPDSAKRVILVYGPDAGLVSERVKMLALLVVPDPDDPFRTAHLTAAAVADDTARLYDEMAAQSLGGGRRLIRLSAAESATGAIASLLKDPPPTDSLLLIEAGDLDKKSKLRLLCENEALAVTIACYAEEGAARQRTIADILQAEGLRIDRDALMALADILPSDRMAMRSELEKLALYARGQKEISLRDIEAVIQDAGAAELDDLIYAVASGDAARSGTLMARLWEEQTSPVAILRAAQRHFMRLAQARAQMDEGLNAAEAVKRLSPPVFWKFENAFAAQLRRWSSARIEAALSRLYEAEAAVKRTGIPDQTLCAQLLLRLTG
ncbi:MAG: DNA polymerase III subunit delta [Alphaproteobacteria bacterium]|nr:DNA polymerase III subunit delta [Alphaproteobacteria bacterium]MBV8548231.1 DNA polymerase III subunit delta [Alphaproteobacteria bacterium]